MTAKFLPEDVKYERLERLNEKNKEVCLKSNEKCIGKVFKVLVEGKTEKDGKRTSRRGAKDCRRRTCTVEK